MYDVMLEQLSYSFSNISNIMKCDVYVWCSVGTNEVIASQILK